jgi:DNA polymerase-1
VSYFIEIAEDQPADGGLFAAVSERRVPQPVAELLADASVPKCGIGLKDIAASLRALDVELEGFGFDAGIASYLLAPHRNDHSLGFLAAQYLGRSIPAPDVHGPDDTPGPAHFAAVSLDVLRELRGPLQRDLDGAGLRSLFDGLEMPLVGVLNDMERNGIAVDTGLLRGLGAELEKAVGYLRERIWELAGQEFNIDSPLQLSGILFDKLHLPRGRRTKTGWSTNADVLEALAGEYEIVAKVLEYREYSKLRSTYVDGLLREVNPKTGRVHTTFEQTTAATGRLSSRAPNLQNIPARKEIGREIRACFIAASPETLLIAADYSQIELRIMAHYSQDPYLVDAFQAGEDIHQRTASAIFDVPVGEVSYDMRRVAKTVNYAVIYGMGAGALAQQIGRSKEEAQRFIDNYFRRLGGVTGFMNKTVADARLNGYVSTILGRRRPIPDINSSAGNVRAYAERAAANTPLQGSAADIIKAAMVGIARGLPSCCADARMLLQVHDELVFESPATEAQRVGWYVKGVMETAVTLSVPITVDVSIGSNWRDMKSLDEPA